MLTDCSQETLQGVFEKYIVPSSAKSLSEQIRSLIEHWLDFAPEMQALKVVLSYLVPHINERGRVDFHHMYQKIKEALGFDEGDF